MTTYTFKLSKNYNFTFSTKVNKHAVNFVVRSFRGIMYVTAGIDGVQCVASFKAVKGVSIFPERYRSVLGGIFQFGGTEDGYPDADSLDGVKTTFEFVSDTDDAET